MADKKLEVKIPMVPNFIKVGEQMVPVHQFSDDELRAIGKEWTDKLIQHAHKVKDYQKKLRNA